MVKKRDIAIAVITTILALFVLGVVLYFFGFFVFGIVLAIVLMGGAVVFAASMVREFGDVKAGVKGTETSSPPEQGATKELDPTKQEVEKEVKEEEGPEKREEVVPLESRPEIMSQLSTTSKKPVTEKLKKVNFLMIGDVKVGKSSLSQRYLHDEFPNKYIATVGANRFQNVTVINEQRVDFRICDVSSNSQYQSVTDPIARSFLTGAVKSGGIILVYDITKPESLEYIREWVGKHINKKDLAQLPSITLVGNKQGEAKESQGAKIVTRKQGQELARELTKDLKTPVFFYETNAKTGQNVTEMFEGAARQALGISSPQVHETKEKKEKLRSSKVPTLQSLIREKMKKPLGGGIFSSKSSPAEEEARKMLCFIALLSSLEEQAKGIIALQRYLLRYPLPAGDFQKKLANVVSSLKSGNSGFDSQYKLFAEVGPRMIYCPLKNRIEVQIKGRGTLVDTTTTYREVPENLVGAFKSAHKDPTSKDLTETEKEAQKLEKSL